MRPLLLPLQIQRKTEEVGGATVPQGTGLEITWRDGGTRFIPSELLRRRCPCATCNEERDTREERTISTKRLSLRVLSATAAEAANLQEVWAIGNYAIGIRWADGHDTGIYSFDILWALTEEAK